MSSITLVDTMPVFPPQGEARKSFAAYWLRELTEQWFNNALPAPDMFYVLVHQPGEIASGPERAAYIGDHAEALEQDTGEVAGAVILTDVLDGVEEFEVLRVAHTGPARSAP